MRKTKRMFFAKKLVITVSALCFVSAMPLMVSADEAQDNFLGDMAEGLNARWEYDSDENTLSSSEIAEYRTALVNEEYSRLAKYADAEFESEKFGLMAQAYIEAIEMQMNATKYYTELPGVYETEWTAGYNLRAALIPDFVDYYGLEVDESEVAAFRQDGGVSIASNAEDTADEENTGGTSSTQEQIVLYDNEGIKVVITGMEEPDLFSTKINVRVENLNHHDICVGASNNQMVVNGSSVYSPLWIQVQSGKTASGTMEFYATDLKAAGIDKIDELSLTIQISDGESFMPIYEGNEIFLAVDDNYIIHEKSVYTDKESIQKVQQLLNDAGYDCGFADGVPGKKTNSALLQFERDNGLPETTDITPELIETLEEAIN